MTHAILLLAIISISTFSLLLLNIYFLCVNLYSPMVTAIFVYIIFFCNNQNEIYDFHACNSQGTMI